MSYKDKSSEGRNSYKRNEGKFICPYDSKSEEYDSFERGWVQALKSSDDDSYNFSDSHFCHDYDENSLPEIHTNRDVIQKTAASEAYTKAYANRK